MIHSQEKISSRTASSRRSKKRKQDDIGENVNLSNEDGSTTRKRKRHRPSPPANTNEGAAAGKDSIAETPKLHEPPHEPIVSKGHGKDGERPKRFIVFIGSPSSRVNIGFHHTNTTRESTVYGNDCFYKQALCVPQACIYSAYHPQRPTHKIQGVRIPRVRRLRQNENMPKAAPPIHLR